MTLLGAIVFCVIGIIAVGFGIVISGGGVIGQVIIAALIIISFITVMWKINKLSDKLDGLSQKKEGKDNE